MGAVYGNALLAELADTAFALDARDCTTTNTIAVKPGLFIIIVWMAGWVLANSAGWELEAELSVPFVHNECLSLHPPPRLQLHPPPRLQLAGPSRPVGSNGCLETELNTYNS